LGFELQNDLLTLSDYGYNKIRLKDAIYAIENMLTLYEGFSYIYLRNKIEKSEYQFDPYKPLVSSLTGFKDPKIPDYEVDPIQKEIELEKEKRKKAAAAPITDREIKVFKISPTQNPSFLKIYIKIATGIDLAILERKVKFEDEPIIPEEAEISVKYMRLKKENEEAQSFKNRAMKKLQKLKKTPVYSKGYLRFKFPDMHILQAAFSPSENIEFVYKFLKDVNF